MSINFSPALSPPLPHSLSPFSNIHFKQPSKCYLMLSHLDETIQRSSHSIYSWPLERNIPFSTFSFFFCGCLFIYLSIYKRNKVAPAIISVAEWKHIHSAIPFELRWKLLLLFHSLNEFTAWIQICVHVCHASLDLPSPLSPAFHMPPVARILFCDLYTYSRRITWYRIVEDLFYGIIWFYFRWFGRGYIRSLGENRYLHT